MLEALAYLRVSGLGQVDGDGFERQRVAISKCAESLGAEIVAEYRDEGVTGKMELEDRPGLAAALAHIEGNGVRVVIVESADRLARDSMVSELIIRQFQKVGCRVISASGCVDLTEGDDTNPTAKLIRQILAAVAEFDRCVTVLKLKAARQRRKAAGERMEGKKPYGFFPDEVAIYADILRLRNDRVSSDKIADFLNEKGYKTRNKCEWRGSSIRKILARQQVSAYSAPTGE